MIGWKKVLVSAMAALVVVEAVYADMMPVCGLEAVCKGCVCDSGPNARQETRLSGLFDGGFSPFGLRSSSIDLRSEPKMGFAEASEVQYYHALTEGSTSFDLCLYALMSLGLCRSAPWVKKLSVGSVPGWYHEGSPLQIGHSVAVSPNCWCSAQVCFIQPDHTEPDRIPQYRLGRVLSLWRKSQSTPTAFAARGPPCMS